MRRLPVLPTLVVAIAVAAMIALGVWQLQRRAEKEAALATLAANIHRVPVDFPRDGSGEALLFRRSTIDCRSVTGFTTQSGRDAAGASGWRVIADCRTPAGQVVPVQIGVAGSPRARPGRLAGPVSGYITHAPDSQPIIARLFDHRPRPLMLVSDVPAAGLSANPGPDLSAVPNNHLAYAVQWFCFAAIAAAVYVLALRRRRRAPR